jgi:hypothetical protein
MSDQQEHDLRMSKVMRENKLLEPGSLERLEALLAKKNGSSSASEPSSGLGPIERAMRNNPKLTRETAERIADEFGF